MSNYIPECVFMSDVMDTDSDNCRHCIALIAQCDVNIVTNYANCGASESNWSSIDPALTIRNNAHFS